jgi:hypothetical protein
VVRLKQWPAAALLVATSLTAVAGWRGSVEISKKKERKSEKYWVTAIIGIKFIFAIYAGINRE